ncbi:28 kDa heat- and acid-stable phosphoprotein-like [Macrobrachium nipponense]|uniref:28 kDa heat- and acid-stable phosphoprotein-like n=1 Tax=Macrobrachium nipponense TaxID=159736 RepID=UPI0030C83564
MYSTVLSYLMRLIYFIISGKHKGGRRQFTNFEALEEQKKKEEKEKQWRKTQGETDSEEEGEGEEKSSASSEESGSEEEEEGEGEDDQKERKPKGVAALIETENPNRVVNKTKKVTELSTTTSGAAAGKPQLSRREREEIEKQRATAHYRKMHAEGKTEEARSDLARLAIIRQQREEAAKKKEEERIAREEAAAAKKEKMARALNKKRS